MAETDTQQAEAAEEAPKGFSLSDLLLYQKVMFRVVLATVPAMGAAVYLFGWRALAVVLVSVIVGFAVEWLFCRKRGEPVSSAVFVTAVLFALTLPPRVPFEIVAVGMVIAIAFGKEVFGGYARNVFNPALVGRCFIYVCFPKELTGQWLTPHGGFPAGLVHWAKGVDAFGRATPLYQFKAGEAVASVSDLFLGDVGGSLGETSALLMILAGIYLIYTKTANWRIIVSCVASGAAFSALFHYTGSESVPGPLFAVLSGGFLFGSVFMATDPISAAQTNPGRYVYGVTVGALTVIIRGFSNFPGGMMFAILLGNMFNPIMDYYIRDIQRARRAARKAAA